MDSLKTKETDLNSHYSSLLQAQKEAETDLDQQRTILDRLTARSELESQELGYQVNTFSTRLGLKIQAICGSSVRITFVNIDPVNPSREFKFVIMQKGEGMYSVEDCHPPVAYSQLVDQLNKSSNVTKFIIGFRNLFKKSI